MLVSASYINAKLFFFQYINIHTHIFDMVRIQIVATLRPVKQAEGYAANDSRRRKKAQPIEKSETYAVREASSQGS